MRAGGTPATGIANAAGYLLHHATKRKGGAMTPTAPRSLRATVMLATLPMVVVLTAIVLYASTVAAWASTATLTASGSCSDTGWTATFKLFVDSNKPADSGHFGTVAGHATGTISVPQPASSQSYTLVDTVTFRVNGHSKTLKATAHAPQGCTVVTVPTTPAPTVATTVPGTPSPPAPPPPDTPGPSPRGPGVSTIHRLPATGMSHAVADRLTVLGLMGVLVGALLLGTRRTRTRP